MTFKAQSFGNKFHLIGELSVINDNRLLETCINDTHRGKLKKQLNRRICKNGILAG